MITTMTCDHFAGYRPCGMPGYESCRSCGHVRPVSDESLVPEGKLT